MDDPAAAAVASTESGASTSEEYSADEAAFWIMTAALKRFVENEGQGDLPLEVILLSQPLWSGKISTILCMLRCFYAKQFMFPSFCTLISTNTCLWQKRWTE